MENNQNIQTSVVATKMQSTQNFGQMQNSQITKPNIIDEAKAVREKHSWISYVLIVLSIIQALSVLFGQIGTIQILGAIYYLLTAILLYKKPVVGYIMFGVAVALFLLALIIYNLTSQY